jgi:hypothetical protein
MRVTVICDLLTTSTKPDQAPGIAHHYPLRLGGLIRVVARHPRVDPPYIAAHVLST